MYQCTYIDICYTYIDVLIINFNRYIVLIHTSAELHIVINVAINRRIAIDHQFKQVYIYVK